MDDLNDKLYKTLEMLVRLRFEFIVSYDTRLMITMISLILLIVV